MFSPSTARELQESSSLESRECKLSWLLIGTERWGQIRLFDNDDETQTGKQGKSQTSLVSCRVLPDIRHCWNLLTWKKKELGGLAPYPAFAPLPTSTYVLQSW